MTATGGRRMKAELHCHTTCSDGVVTPEELLQEAAECGLTHICITDHDTVAAYGMLAGRVPEGIALIPGIEISSRCDDRDVHMLGYFIDLGNAALLAEMEEGRQRRARRTERMAEMLEAAGYDISIGYFEEAGLTLNRSNIARRIAQTSDELSFGDVFDKLIGKGCPFYVEKDDIASEDAIDLIHGAGGIASIAHARHYHVDDLIPHLADCGLDAIECYHCEQDEADARILRTYAEGLELLVTGGSDYHGDDVHPSRLAGNEPPAEDLERFFAAGRGKGFDLP